MGLGLRSIEILSQYTRLRSKNPLSNNKRSRKKNKRLRKEELKKEVQVEKELKRMSQLKICRR